MDKDKIELSVIIPNRNNGKGANFINDTINDVLKNAGCSVEVIVNVDEAWPSPLLDDRRITYIHPSSPVGLRTAVNNCVRLARGKYILKTDDHCAFGKDFGKILIENHQENWVQIPRRYALDAENWKIDERTDDKYPIDYMYIDFPRKGKAHDDGMHGVPWKHVRNLAQNKPEFDIDDTPSMQGSCYFMTKNHFDNFLGTLNATEGEYGNFAQESQEIGFKTWLGGGRLVVNKKTWYAHLYKGRQYGRMYRLDDADHKRGSSWSADYWLNNKWEGRVHDFAWFINEKFPGMPSWPKHWEQEILDMGWIK